MRIFVVENHPDTRELLSLYLEGMGHTVLGASTMTEALEQIPGSRCDVLISDVGLPDGDGWELLGRLPGPRPAYAIAMTGHGTNTDQAKSKAAGFRRHLLKPFVTDELERALVEAAREAAARIDAD